MKKIKPFVTVAVIAIALGAATITHARPSPIGTAFTYQGQIKQAGTLLNNTADFQFTLWDALSAGVQVAGPVAVNSVSIANGLFAVPLDFGASAFGADARFLEIAVRSPAGGGAFTTLAPRQALTPTPFSLQTRGIVVNSLNHVGIGDTSPAGLFTVGTNDAFQVAASGDVTLLNDLASITFPQCDATNQPMIQMFASGGGNADRMVIAHSPGFPDWGLQYQDTGDRFRFVKSGVATLTIDLNSGGDMGFADDQGSINFPAASGATAPMINMFPDSGNVSRMVLAHSPMFDNWGLQYDDPNDRFNFLANGNPVLTVDLSSQNVGVGISNPDPFYKLLVNGTCGVNGSIIVAAPSGSTGINIQSTDATCAVIRRFGTDGDLTTFFNDGVAVGSISVAGGTVSYNAFTGSHFGWTDQNIDRAMLVSLTGINRRTHTSADGEMIYGIAPTVVANDSRCLGAYLGLREPSLPANDENPHLVMAVGNGEMLVVDAGLGDIQPGEYLIASDVPGCAMKDDPQRFPIGYIVARAAEPVAWSDVTIAPDGAKRATVSVLFEQFIRNSEADRLAREVADLKSRLAAMHEMRNLRDLRQEKDAQIAAQQTAIDELLRRVTALEQGRSK